jgi:hypothetical protein
MNPGIFETATIINIIHTGAAFGVLHGTGANCYIPAMVLGTDLEVGAEVSVLLVDNPNEDARYRTPYMVRFVRRAPFDSDPNKISISLAAPDPVFDRAGVEAHVRAKMNAGGVWKVLTMFQDYMGNDEATREDNLQAYNTVSAILRKMHDSAECAKWSFWAKGAQSKPSREWFSCYPQKIEVAEWEDA